MGKEHVKKTGDLLNTQCYYPSCSSHHNNNLGLLLPFKKPLNLKKKKEKKKSFCCCSNVLKSYLLFYLLTNALLNWPFVHHYGSEFLLIAEPPFEVTVRHINPQGITSHEDKVLERRFFPPPTFKLLVSSENSEKKTSCWSSYHSGNPINDCNVWKLL